MEHKITLRQFYAKRYAKECPIDKAAMDAWFDRKGRKLNKHQVKTIIKKILM